MIDNQQVQNHQQYLAEISNKFPPTNQGSKLVLVNQQGKLLTKISEIISGQQDKSEQASNLTKKEIRSSSIGQLNRQIQRNVQQKRQRTKGVIVASSASHSSHRGSINKLESPNSIRSREIQQEVNPQQSRGYLSNAGSQLVTVDQGRVLMHSIVSNQKDQKTRSFLEHKVAETIPINSGRSSLSPLEKLKSNAQGGLKPDIAKIRAYQFEKQFRDLRQQYSIAQLATNNLPKAKSVSSHQMSSLGGGGGGSATDRDSHELSKKEKINQLIRLKDAYEDQYQIKRSIAGAGVAERSSNGSPDYNKNNDATTEAFSRQRAAGNMSFLHGGGGNMHSDNNNNNLTDLRVEQTISRGKRSKGIFASALDIRSSEKYDESGYSRPITQNVSKIIVTERKDGTADAQTERNSLMRMKRMANSNMKNMSSNLKVASRAKGSNSLRSSPLMSLENQAEPENIRSEAFMVETTMNPMNNYMATGSQHQQQNTTRIMMVKNLNYGRSQVNLAPTLDSGVHFKTTSNERTSEQPPQTHRISIIRPSLQSNFGLNKPHLLSVSRETAGNKTPYEIQKVRQNIKISLNKASSGHLKPSSISTTSLDLRQNHHHTQQQSEDFSKGGGTISQQSTTTRQYQSISGRNSNLRQRNVAIEHKNAVQATYGSLRKKGSVRSYANLSGIETCSAESRSKDVAALSNKSNSVESKRKAKAGMSSKQQLRSLSLIKLQGFIAQNEKVANQQILQKPSMQISHSSKILTPIKKASGMLTPQVYGQSVPSRDEINKEFRTINSNREISHNMIIQEQMVQENRMTEANMSDESDNSVDELGEFSQYLKQKSGGFNTNQVSPNRNLKMNRSMLGSQDSTNSVMNIKRSISSLKDRQERASLNRSKIQHQQQQSMSVKNSSSSVRASTAHQKQKDKSINLQDLSPSQTGGAAEAQKIQPKQPLPYRVTISSKDVKQSSHYRMAGGPKQSIINPELDIKNKVLKDKRRALIRVLKDKRPTLNGFERNAYNRNQQARKKGFKIKQSMSPQKGPVNEHMTKVGSKLFPQLHTMTSENLQKVKSMRDLQQGKDKQSAIYQNTDYFETREKAAQYPRAKHMYAQELFKEQEPDLEDLQKIFIEHWDHFDDEYKRKLFALGEQELQQEAMNKYNRVKGQAKINFLALNKKSKQKILNSYFKDQTCNEKMDNLVERLKLYKIFKP